MLGFILSEECSTVDRGDLSLLLYFPLSYPLTPTTLIEERVGVDFRRKMARASWAPPVRNVLSYG